MLFITLLCVRKIGVTFEEKKIFFFFCFGLNYVNSNPQILFSLTSLKRERELVGSLGKKKDYLPVI